MAGQRLELVDAPAWERAREGLAGSTVFHSWWFLQLAANALGARFHPLALTRSRAIVALVPIVERTRGPLRTFNWVPFPYVGPLGPVAELPTVLAALSRLAWRRRAAVVQVSFREEHPGVREALIAAGFEVVTDTTMTLAIDGRSKGALWDGMRQNGRRDLRKVEASGFEVRDASRADVVEYLPHLLAGVPDTGWPARATSAAAWAALSNTEHAWMRTVIDAHGVVQAVTITLLDGRSAYLWLGAALRQDRLDAHAPIYWDAIGRAVEGGLEEVDMVGAPNPQIAAYKRKFGASDSDVLVAQSFRLPGYRRLQRLHQQLTRTS